MSMLSIATNVPLWRGMLILGEAVHVGGWCGEPLYPPVNFAVNPKVLLKSKVYSHRYGCQGRGAGRLGDKGEGLEVHIGSYKIFTGT